MEQFLYLHRLPGPVSSLIISNQIVDILGGRAPGWLPLIKMTLRGEANIFSSPHAPHWLQSNLCSFECQEAVSHQSELSHLAGGWS